MRIMNKSVIPISLLLASILMVLVAWCQQSKPMVQQRSYDLMLKGFLKHSVPEISVQQAVSAIHSYQIIDARSQREYEVSHIKGARFYNFDKPETLPGLLNTLDKSQPVLIYCSVGYRSEKVAKKFMEAGFPLVYNLYGGLFEWSNQQQPLYRGDSLTRQIHGYNKVWSKWITKGEKVLTP